MAFEDSGEKRPASGFIYFLSEMMSKLSGNADMLAAFGIVGVVVMFVIPLPTFLLDLLMSVNIAISLVLVLTATYIKDALELSIFPSLLLTTTLFRLALNVSSTRLILLDAENFDGEVIRTFGNFVVGGNYVVGIIIFIILVLIQFLVITKGSERVAEVAARFTLDSLPGKQMSIDADLNSGLIDENQAKDRRKKLQKEIDFYGAMDGASKFVKGDTVAGIVITVINIIAGMIVGYFFGNFESLADIAQTYTLLTVGDGLVSIIPSLLISVATGLVVTKAAEEDNLGQQILVQMLGQPKALGLASFVFILFAAIPGLPKTPFFVMAALLGCAWYILDNNITRESFQSSSEETSETPLSGSAPKTGGTSSSGSSGAGSKNDGDAQEPAGPEDVAALLHTDTMELEIGYGLIPMVDPNQGGDLLNRVKMIRRQIAMELGLVVPPVRIRDNMQLSPNQYSIKLKGVEIGVAEVYHDKFLAMDPGMVQARIDGISTVEPAFNLPALWIEESQREEAEMNGYTVVDCPSVVSTHLTELIKRNASEILGRKETKELVDKLRETSAVVVEAAIPENSMPRLGLVQKVLQSLLREGISIRNLSTILEAVADYVETAKNIEGLVENVRQALSRQITARYTVSGVLRVINIEPAIEQKMVESIQKHGSLHNAMSPLETQNFFRNLDEIIEDVLVKGYEPILMCTPLVRQQFKMMIERAAPQLVVLSFSEIVMDIQVECVGTVGVGAR